MATKQPLSSQTPITTPPPEIPQTPPASPQKKSPNIIMITFMVLLLGATGLLAFQNYQLKQQLAQQQPNSLPPTSTDTPPSANITPSTLTPTTTVNPTADWEMYENKTTGIEVKYPKDILLNDQPRDSNKLHLSIYSKDLSNYTDQPMGFDLKTATSDKVALGSGDYGSKVFGSGIPGSEKVIKVNGLYAKTYINFQQLDVCNVQFTRGLIFYKNDHQINIYLQAPSNYANKMPNYFTQDPENCGSQLVWKSTEDFYTNLENNSAPKIALDWYSLFNQIISNIKFTN